MPAPTPTAGTLDLTELLDGLDFHPACEHSDHDKAPRFHSGDAEWLAQGFCPKCGYKIDMLCCDKWRRFVSGVSAASPHRVRCKVCGDIHISNARFTRLPTAES